MKKGFKRVLAIIVMVIMIVTMLPAGAFKVYAGEKTRTIIIGSELELKHGIISVRVIPEGEWSVGNPEQHLHFVGEPDRIVFNVCPTIQIGPEGYEITAEEGQRVHVEWTPDPGYEYYSGSARYVSVANGHVVFFQGSVGDDVFIVPDFRPTIHLPV